MSRYTLYAYVDGSDIEEVAAALELCFDEFVRNHKWVGNKPWVVNQHQGDSTCSQEGDLPLWDLGLNVVLPDACEEIPGWFVDIEAIAIFLGELKAIMCRDFIIGISDAQTGIAEDLVGVTGPHPDLAQLRAIVGVGEGI